MLVRVPVTLRVILVFAFTGCGRVGFVEPRDAGGSISDAVVDGSRESDVTLDVALPLDVRDASLEATVDSAIDAEEIGVDASADALSDAFAATADGQDDSPSADAGLSDDAPSDAPRARPVHPPVVFHTDLLSGPNQGGGLAGAEGTYLTIYGAFFGATQGTSKAGVGVGEGGGEVSRYLSWQDDRIVVALGPTAATGPVVVETPAGMSNNDVRFSVRAGNLRCVDGATGLDTNSGSFGACWRTVDHAITAVLPGDIVYLHSSVTTTAAISVFSGGTQSLPVAFVGFPGSRPTLNTNGNAVFSPSSASVNFIVLSNLAFTGTTAVDVRDTTGWRVVGNDIACDAVRPGTGCVMMGGSLNAQLLSNEIHDVEGPAGQTSVEAGNARGLRVVRNRFRANRLTDLRLVYSGGASQFGDVLVSHNEFRDGRCGAILVAGTDDRFGAVRIDNNVFALLPTGPDARSSCESHECVAVDTTGSLNGFGAVSARQNTLVGCGVDASGSAAFSNDSTTLTLNLTANVVVLSPAETFFAGTGALTASTNLWSGAGSPPVADATALLGSPIFINAAGADYRLSASSPAIDRVTAVGGATARDFRGGARTVGALSDLGAFERDSMFDP